MVPQIYYWFQYITLFLFIQYKNKKETSERDGPEGYKGLSKIYYACLF